MIVKVTLENLEDISSVVDKYQEFYKKEYNNPTYTIRRIIQSVLP